MIAARLGLTLLMFAAPPAIRAASSSAAPKARLQRCGAETCLLVRGYRQDPSVPILIAGHAVRVEGAHTWRVALPLATVQGWSAPWARSLPVQVGGPGAPETAARLPIGLLGHREDLAFLDVRVPR